MVLRSGLLRAVLRCAALFLLVMVVPVMLRAASPPVPSSPPERVVDLANIIEPALEGQLVASLHELEEKTTAQMAVLTVSSLDGETVEAFSLHTFGQWKLGQKGKDNGLLLTVALKERKYRFETGYGLEGTLPDSLIGSIGREKLVPFFKEGKYSEGIAAATKEVLAVLAKQYNVQLTGGERLPKAAVISRLDRLKKFLKDNALYLFLPVWFVIILIRRRRRHGSIYDDHSTWSSSDSSSDSSFSGGGGDSGGGGSSGDW